MYYKVKLEQKASKFIHKLKNPEKEQVSKAIDSLEEKPFPTNKKHILKSIGITLLCEMAIGKLRIYYTIENQFVVIENIKYAGIVSVLDGKRNHKSGNKNNPNQQKDIKNLKKHKHSR